MSEKKLEKCPIMQKSFGTNGKNINEVIILLHIFKPVFLNVGDSDVGDEFRMFIVDSELFGDQNG